MTPDWPMRAAEYSVRMVGYLSYGKEWTTVQNNKRAKSSLKDHTAVDPSKVIQDAYY